METTSLIAFGIAVSAVSGLIISLFGLNILVGAVETLFGKPSLTVLKSAAGGNHFAFALKWNSAKEPARMDFVRIRLFNPNGSPTQAEVSMPLEKQAQTFAADVDMGPGYLEMLGAKGFESARITVEVGSEVDGTVFTFEMRSSTFSKKIKQADKTAQEYMDGRSGGFMSAKNPIDVPLRSFIADTVPGTGSQIAIATNPAFANLFAGGGAAGAAGGEAAADVPNFTVSKVWIEPGCIVCNACEDIYPEVFDVTADTCLIKPNAPLDNGLLIQDSAEACPVEVIKFTVAS